MITPTAQVFAQMRDNVLAAPDEESRLFAVAHREWRKFIKVRRKWPQHQRVCQSTTVNALAEPTMVTHNTPARAVGACRNG